MAFLNDSSEHLSPLENTKVPTSKAFTEAGDDSLTFIQNTASQYPSSKPESWLKGQLESTPSDASTFLHEPEVDDAPDTASAATDDSSDKHPTKDGSSQSSSTKNILKLAYPRKEVEDVEGLAKVKVFNRSVRSLIPAQASGVGSTEPSDSDESSLLPTISSAPEVPASTSQTYEEISDENDEDVEYPAIFELELNTPISLQTNSGLEDQEDPVDLDHDLHDLSIYELEVEREENIPSVEDDFRDLEDDYAAYAFDPNEVFDSEYLETEDKTDEVVDKLSREDRALQKAAELIGKANWAISTLPLVQQIFVMSGWGATRLALEREIEKGLTPEELILAAHVKVIWAENDIYWITFDKTGSSRLSYYVLSWPTALLIVRSFESIPQVEEIEVFLEKLFASWYENNTLRRAFKAFARYLWFRFANLQGCLPASQHFDFCNPHELSAEEYSDLGLCDALEYEKTKILREYGVFQTKHPQEPSCYFSDKPAEEETPSLNAEKRSKIQADDTDMPSDTETKKEIIDDDVAEALPQWSAAPLASALRAKNTDQSSPSIEPQE